MAFRARKRFRNARPTRRCSTVLGCHERSALIRNVGARDESGESLDSSSGDDDLDAGAFEHPSVRPANSRIGHDDVNGIESADYVTGWGIKLGAVHQQNQLIRTVYQSAFRRDQDNVRLQDALRADG